MAKKTEKKTRASQYETILKDYNTTLSECIVMSFKFKNEGRAYGYHFALFTRKLKPLIYDGPYNIVRIVLKKVDENIDTYINIAKDLGGEYKECKGYNDYE